MRLRSRLWYNALRAESPFAKPCFPPPASAHGFFRRPRRSRRKCCRWSTSRSSSTASKKPSRPGVDNIILVTGRGKNAIEDHFDVSVELETFLEARGKRDQLDEVRKISNMINFAYVRQGEPLASATPCSSRASWSATSRSPCMLGDDVIDADPPAIKQMIDVFDRVKGPVLAVERVPRENISSYGVIAIEPSARPRSWRLPGARSGREAAARRSAVGPGDHRPLHAHARHFSRAGRDASDRTGEIQLTNGLRELLKSRPIYACEVNGVRHDTGNKLGYLKAMVYFAMKRPDLAEPFVEYLETRCSANSPERLVCRSSSVGCRRSCCVAVVDDRG